MSKLKELREEKGLSQSDLSSLANINFRTLQDYEQGRKSLDKAQAITVYKLCKALNCNIEDILEL